MITATHAFMWVTMTVFVEFVVLESVVVEILFLHAFGENLEIVGKGEHHIAGYGIESAVLDIVGSN